MVMVGKDGLTVINNSETNPNTYCWGEAEPLAAGYVSSLDKTKIAANEALVVVVKDAIERLALEYASQKGEGGMTPTQLQQAFESLRGDKTFEHLQTKFLEEYQSEVSLGDWVQVFTSTAT